MEELLSKEQRGTKTSESRSSEKRKTLVYHPFFLRFYINNVHEMEYVKTNARAIFDEAMQEI